MTDNLSPCPFCGGEDANATRVMARSYRAGCLSCGAGVIGDTMLEAVAAWNRRAQAEESSARPDLSEALADLEREAHATRDTANGNTWMHGKAVGLLEAVGRIEHAIGKSSPPARAEEPPFRFTRYHNGELRAEGVRINAAATLEEAIPKAVKLCRDPGCTVLVYRGQEEARTEPTPSTSACLSTDDAGSQTGPAEPGANPPPLAGPGYDRGSILWHSSEEDGGPDVGVQVGLGGGFSLYCGELPTATLEDHGVDLKTYPDGWWATLYGPQDQWIIGAIPDPHVAREALDHIAALFSSPPARFEQAALARDAARYRYLRSRDAGPDGELPPAGLFIGQVPENLILTSDDADQAIDTAMGERVG